MHCCNLNTNSFMHNFDFLAQKLIHYQCRMIFSFILFEHIHKANNGSTKVVNLGRGYQFNQPMEGLGKHKQNSTVLNVSAAINTQIMLIHLIIYKC